jgi:hypothetical protein
MHLDDLEIRLQKSQVNVNKIIAIIDKELPLSINR